MRKNTGKLVVSPAIAREIPIPAQPIIAHTLALLFSTTTAAKGPEIKVKYFM